MTQWSLLRLLLSFSIFLIVENADKLLIFSCYWTNRCFRLRHYLLTMYVHYAWLLAVPVKPKYKHSAYESLQYSVLVFIAPFIYYERFMKEAAIFWYFSLFLKQFMKDKEIYENTDPNSGEGRCSGKMLRLPFLVF